MGIKNRILFVVSDMCTDRGDRGMFRPKETLSALQTWCTSLIFLLISLETVWRRISKDRGAGVTGVLTLFVYNRILVGNTITLENF